MEHRRYPFGKRLRLSLKREFQAVYEARERKSVGPMLVYSRPNGLGHSRLGLSVSRRVGGAVQRNKVKRLLREAFRHLQHDYPAGYDFVVVVRPHQLLALPDYQRALFKAATTLHQRWTHSDQQQQGSQRAS